jgi:ABC-type taurine transport system ATPase subunit
MALLEMRDATFAQAGTTIVSSTTLTLDEGERLARACVTDRCAAVLALMAAGLVKCTTGNIFVGAFDPRIQPVQVKRMVGFVPHDAVPHSFSSFTRYVEYRAALWGLPRAESVVRAGALLAKLDGVHEAFAYPLVGALLGTPRLIVLDRPQAAYAQQLLDAVGECAIFSTHASARDAERFSRDRLISR